MGYAILHSTDNKYWIYNTKEENEEGKLKEKYLELMEIEQELLRKAEEKRLELKKKREKKRADKEQRVAHLIDPNYQIAQRPQWEKDFQKDPIWIKTSRLLNLKEATVPEISTWRFLATLFSDVTEDSGKATSSVDISIIE
ncbi:hypothetical protein AX762_07420 [Alkalibacterium sp. 20]|nr:hypothetical protein AX762_07420 [Alkalibacterium sp. 20]